MPQSLANIFIHLVFSTKDRVPYLDESIRKELYPYLAKIIRSSSSECYEIGGTEDHVHFAIRMHRTLCVSKLVEDLKSSSSSWLKHKGSSLSTFSWQRGYGAFSYGISDVRSINGYISGQIEHHKQVSFQDELRKLLQEQGIAFDEKYLWD